MKTSLLKYVLVFGTWAFGIALECPANTEVFIGDTRLDWTLTLDGVKNDALSFNTGDPDNQGVFIVAEVALIEVALNLKPKDLILVEASLETKLVQQVKILNDGQTTEPKVDTPFPEWYTSEFKFNENVIPGGDPEIVESLKIEIKSTSAEMKVKNLFVKGCIPVQWCEWGGWGNCEVSCGEGVRERDRECKCSNPNLLFKCEGSAKKTEICQGPCCKKPPTWGDWDPYSSCSVTCGGGVKERKRTCIPHKCPDETECPGKNKETLSCNEDCCQKPPTWGDWDPFGECSVSCGGGVKERKRKCIDDICADGSKCPGKNTDTATCNEDCCKKPPTWGPWSDWDKCSVTCGGGEQGRSRQCIPHACPDDSDCDGKKSESRACNTQCCIGESIWSQWTEWAACSETCGLGTRGRSRDCEKDPDCPVVGDAVCDGKGKDTEECNDGCCQVPPFWSNWNPWEPCPVTCGGGVQRRDRTCRDDPDCPDPVAECPGKGSDTRICSDDCCPVAPSWSKWKRWGSCSGSCGTGVQSRKRKCKKDKLCPLIGVKCPGKGKMTQSCDKPCCREVIDFNNKGDVEVIIKGGLGDRDGSHLLRGSGTALENLLLDNIDGTEKVEITFVGGSKNIIQVGVETFLAGKVKLSADPGPWDAQENVDASPSAGFSNAEFDAPGGQINNQDKITVSFNYPTGEIAVKALFLIVCI